MMLFDTGHKCYGSPCTQNAPRRQGIYEQKVFAYMMFERLSFQRFKFNPRLGFVAEHVDTLLPKRCKVR